MSDIAALLTVGQLGAAGPDSSARIKPALIICSLTVFRHDCERAGVFPLTFMVLHYVFTSMKRMLHRVNFDQDVEFHYTVFKSKSLDSEC